MFHYSLKPVECENSVIVGEVDKGMRHNRKDFVSTHLLGMLFLCQQNAHFLVQQQKLLDDLCMARHQSLDNHCSHLQSHDLPQGGGDILDWHLHLYSLYRVILFLHRFVHFVEPEIEAMCLMVWLLGFKDVRKWFGVYFSVRLLLQLSRAISSDASHLITIKSS